MLRSLTCSVLFLASCGHKCPPPVQPPPTIQLSKSPDCRLPELPGPIKPVIGWPTPDTVMVSKSDMVEILEYVAAMRDWIQVASACLENR